MESVVPLRRCFCLSPPELRHRIVYQSRRDLHLSVLSSSSSFGAGRFYLTSYFSSLLRIHPYTLSGPSPGILLLPDRKNRFLSPVAKKASLNRLNSSVIGNSDEEEEEEEEEDDDDWESKFLGEIDPLEVQPPKKRKKQPKSKALDDTEGMDWCVRARKIALQSIEARGLSSRMAEVMPLKKKKKKKKKIKKDKVKSKTVPEDDFDSDDEGLEFLDRSVEEDKMGELRWLRG
ncbi:hypothetical protein F2Q70_00008236 [Brassica cretica]|uniref:Uncharacterized protein n=1 Tax=Brassica cretica TaxID=69181 RepID=A0A8S9LZM4_BRACR|nr:hypothetical protein F2Q70_00008236 [Brassica cretica]